jgi:hypothetical protein
VKKVLDSTVNVAGVVGGLLDPNDITQKTSNPSGFTGSHTSNEAYFLHQLSNFTLYADTDNASVVTGLSIQSLTARALNGPKQTLNKDGAAVAVKAYLGVADPANPHVPIEIGNAYAFKWKSDNKLYLEFGNPDLNPVANTSGDVPILDFSLGNANTSQANPYSILPAQNIEPWPASVGDVLCLPNVFQKIAAFQQIRDGLASLYLNLTVDVPTSNDVPYRNLHLIDFLHGFKCLEAVESLLP